MTDSRRLTPESGFSFQAATASMDRQRRYWRGGAMVLSRSHLARYSYHENSGRSWIIDNGKPLGGCILASTMNIIIDHDNPVGISSYFGNARILFFQRLNERGLSLKNSGDMILNFQF